MRNAVLLAMTMAAALAGCVSIPFPGGGARELRAVEPKPVTEKEAPVSLFAIDGSRCVVTEERFTQVRIGEEVWCMWLDRRTPSGTTTADRRSPPDGRRPALGGLPSDRGSRSGKTGSGSRR
jgi:hypothetical protein